ncbi:MAG: hypothetical protein JNK74_16175 [Candidatus Hydrogenedentes bacterium]|nr:hypothetical protein [Candidatus Hydrogenedentota bacterium]
MNYKGIALFLGLSYALITLCTFAGAAQGLIVLENPNLFRYLMLAALMGIPALSALIAGFVFPDEHSRELPLWPLPLRPAIGATLAAPVLFGLSYTLATLFGFTQPQWSLGGLMNRVTAQLSTPLSPEVESAAPAVALIAYPIFSILVGATLFAFLAVGSEMGWRAYLLPRLETLGRPAATLITGLCWGLWFLPLVYAWHQEVQLPGFPGAVLRILALAVVLSFFLAGILRRTGHIGVCAMALGAFAGQDSGIWGHLFEQSTAPWTGTAGWVNIVVWGLAAFAISRWGAGKDLNK